MCARVPSGCTNDQEVVVAQPRSAEDLDLMAGARMVGVVMRTSSASCSRALCVCFARRGQVALDIGLGHALIDRGHRVLFMRTSELVQRLQAARRDLQLPGELAKLDRFDLLILDDLSYARRDQAETSVLFELIAERYERKSIAITANAPFSAWDEVFPDKAMTVAAVDRLVHHSTILEMNVDSYRRRAALPARRQRSAPEAR